MDRCPLEPAGGSKGSGWDQNCCQTSVPPNLPVQFFVCASSVFLSRLLKVRCGSWGPAWLPPIFANSRPFGLDFTGFQNLASRQQTQVPKNKRLSSRFHPLSWTSCSGPSHSCPTEHLILFTFAVCHFASLARRNATRFGAFFSRRTAAFGLAFGPSHEKRGQRLSLRAPPSTSRVES